MQEGLDQASRSCTFRCAILPAQEVAAYTWCAVCKTHVGWCQRLRIRRLRPGRTRTFAPAPPQHNIPIDGLFSFTLPCAMQNPWYLPAALWFRCKQKVLSHVRTSEAVGSGRRYTALEGARTAHPSRPSTETVQEQQDWEDSPPPRWLGDADFQLSPTQPVVRRSKAALVVQVKSPPTLRSGNTEM